MSVGDLTLGQIVTQVLQRCDEANSNFIGASEVRDNINGSALELYDLLRQKFDARYFINGTNPDGYVVQTSPANDYIALPNDFLTLVGVDWQIFPGRYVSLRQQMPQYRNRLPYASWAYSYDYIRCNVEYELRGNFIVFTPLPNAAYNLRILYVPQLNMLATDGSADGYYYNQTLAPYYEYIVVDAAIKCVQKNNADISSWMQQKVMLINRIEEAAAVRNLSEPSRAISWADVAEQETFPFGW